MSVRFAAAERPDISVVTPEEQDAILRRLHDDDGMSCCKTLHVGIFFDGTRNNAERDRSGHKHSNVARLWDAFPQDKYHKAIYVAGVGTPFVVEVGDHGVGLQAAAGAAAGWAGEGRINWALLQVQNVVHECAFKVGLSEALGVKDKDLVKSMSVDMNFKGIDSGGAIPGPGSLGDIKARSSTGAGALKLMAAEQNGINELTWEHDSIWAQLKSEVDSSKWTAAMQAWDTMRRKVLNERLAQLKDRVGDKLVKGKPALRTIRLYVFGFSRGSAEARTFSNWLPDALDNFNLCGVPVSYEFLGIFDTVASVGIAQGAAPTLFDGHGGWGRGQLMAVPPYVRRCVHMVAAHEPRGSFPLDLIDRSADGRVEIVYPGVHSDVGGGYAPAEQGRGRDDSDKLSQVPLLDMYREARKAGVPLDVKGPGVSAEAANAFKISAGLKQAFAAYVNATAGCYHDPSHGTPGLMRAHYGYYLRWRKLRLKSMRAQPGFKAAQAGYPQDATDLDSANQELQMEWDDLLQNEKDGGPSLRYYFGKYGENWLHDNPKGAAVASAALAPIIMILGVIPGGVPLTAEVSKRAMKVAQAQLQDKWDQWRQVRDDWNSTVPLADAISALYDNYMHDSRAWFKPMGDDDDVWNYRQIQALKAKQAGYARAHDVWKTQMESGLPGALPGLRTMNPNTLALGPGIGMSPGPEPQSPLTAQESDVLKRYDAAMQAAQQARADKSATAPSDSAVLTDPKVTNGLQQQAGGREPYCIWGYLRWRTVYVDGKRWEPPHVETPQEQWEGELKLNEFRASKFAWPG
ncbi:T6SS phospholipase effector Tle1-like catalytic domain-containing protein [Burkholderia sp. LMG 32019]|uniref:T6SS phospholipase effector Tle1-like catalytic domain-containing protein n=1 Tax=Burkholderia sp. LMG 32019 TaxID=3158173 RepID=UPI003C2B55BA